MNEAALLEAGIALAGITIAGAALLLGGGRIAEEAVRAGRQRGRRPARGSVPSERHRQIGTAAPR